MRHRALGRATPEQRLGICLSGLQETNTIMKVLACKLEPFYLNLILIFLTVNNVADSSLSDPCFFYGEVSSFLDFFFLIFSIYRFMTELSS